MKSKLSHFSLTGLACIDKLRHTCQDRLPQVVQHTQVTVIFHNCNWAVQREDGQRFKFPTVFKS